MITLIKAPFIGVLLIVFSGVASAESDERSKAYQSTSESQKSSVLLPQTTPTTLTYRIPSAQGASTIRVSLAVKDFEEIRVHGHASTAEVMHIGDQNDGVVSAKRCTPSPIKLEAGPNLSESHETLGYPSRAK